MLLRRVLENWFAGLLFIFHCYELSAYYLIYQTTRLDCSLKPAYYEGVSCKLHTANDSRVYAEFEVFIKKPLQNVTIHLKTFRKGAGQRYRASFVDLQFNLCNVLNDRKSIVVGSLVNRIFSKQLHLNRSCYFSGRVRGENIFIAEKYTPPSGYEGKLKIVVRILEGPSRLDTGTITAYVDAVNRDKMKNSK